MSYSPSGKVHPTVVTRDDAERVLGPHLGRGNGKFLLRPSASAKGAYGISVVNNNEISHYKIDIFKSRKYGIQDGLHFVTLQDLVDHYVADRDGLCCRLTRNVLDGDATTQEVFGWHGADDPYNDPNDLATYTNEAAVQRAQSMSQSRQSQARPSRHSYEVYENEIPPTLHQPSRRSTMSRASSSEPNRRSIPSAQIVRGAQIGSGEFGEVCSGTWMHDGIQEQVAIKYLKNTDAQSQAEFKTEADRIMRFNHKYIVGVKGLVTDNGIALVLELLPLGALNKYLKARVNQLSASLLLSYITQIAEGMEYLEQMGVLHRDLAARNILVKTPQHVQISDFGLSRVTDDSKDYYKAESKGKWPIKWYALECIYYRKFTHKSDVWSFGVTSWEVFNYGKKPYHKLKGQQVVALLEDNIRLPQPENCSLDLYALMLRCWDVHPEQRPAFSQIVNELRVLAGGRTPSARESQMQEIRVTMDNQKLYDVLPDPTELRVLEEESRKHVVQSLTTKQLNRNSSLYISFNAISFLPDSFPGAFGPVKHGRLPVAGQPRPVAIKSIEKLDTLNVVILQEKLEGLLRINSPYVVRLHGIAAHPNKSVLVLFEYMKQGPLDRYLRRARIDTPQAARFVTQIASAMNHLESLGIVHGDLAARNVFVHNNLSCKVSDVGMSRALGLGPDYYRSVQNGKIPMKWYALEAIKSNNFTSKSDVWSWGVTTWEIMTRGKSPWERENGTQVLMKLQRNERLELPQEFSLGPMIECKRLVERSWNAIPNQRPSFSEIFTTMNRIAPASSQGY